MKMKRFPAFFSWLTLAALADWLITRTLTRAAIFMPKSPLAIQAYQVIGPAAQVASNLAGLLAFLALGWIAWRQLRGRQDLALGTTLLGLLLVSLATLVIPSAGVPGLAFHALYGAALLLVARGAWKRPAPAGLRPAVTLSCLALLAGAFSQAIPGVYTVLGLSGTSPLGGELFTLGELLVLLSAFALGGYFGRGSPWWVWLAAGLPALLFTLPRLLAPAMAGILAIWSTGLTLYLPWPFYTAGIWAGAAGGLNAARRDPPAAWALLLLAAGGYAPQLNVHAFLGLVAVWLLAGSRGETAPAGRAVSPIESPALTGLAPGE
jgi:hypothetical protein